MKKLFLSAALIIGFTAYAVFERKTESADLNIPPVISSSPFGSLATTSNISALGSTPPTPTTTQAVASQAKASPAATQATQPNITATPAPAPAQSPVPTPAPTPTPQGQYKDGQYTGSVADAYYGNLQVQATVSGGKLTDVVFLDYPQDRGTSREINSQAMPQLISEAISAQSANVNIVSGATQSSMAFQQSLGSALAQAKN